MSGQTCRLISDLGHAGCASESTPDIAINTSGFSPRSLDAINNQGKGFLRGL